MHDSPKSHSIEPDDARLASLMEFSAAAGHEINNPLAVILGRVQLLLPGEPDISRQQSLQTIAAQAMRIRDMIGDVMIVADPPAPHPQSFAVREELEEHIGQLRANHKRDYPDSPVDVDFTCDDGITITADRDQFLTVIGEIIRNALHPSTQAEYVQIKIELAASSEDRLRIEVRDNGRGLTELERAHLFDPYFSGRQAGRGLGFGLCKAWRLAALHAATIKVDEVKRESDQAGLRFEIDWPLEFAATDR